MDPTPPDVPGGAAAAPEPLPAAPPGLAEGLLAALPDGVLAFDAACRYTAWNPAMERISGVPAARVLGRVAWEVFPFLREEGEEAFFLAALRGEARTASDRPFRVPESGREGFFQARYAPVHGADGEVAGGMAVIRDVTETRRAEQAMRLQSRVLESMSEGVSVSDEEGFILYTNPAEDRIFGYEPGELAGRHVTIQNALPEEENRRVVAEVIETLRRDGVWTGEWENRRKDGTPFTTFARITALEMGGRHLWVCVQEDITERKRAALAAEAARAEAERAREEAEEASRAKSLFLATMSHEIRTPINAIVGYADLLELEVAGPLAQAQRAQVGRIKASSRHLLALINDVLDLAKVESGQVAVERRAAPIAEAAEEALAILAPQAAAAGLALENRCDTAMRYAGDPDRVRQVLVNLLSNAVKFTPAGGRITLGCALEAAPSGGAEPSGPGPWVRAWVEDTGIGIAPGMAAAVFEPFVQAESGHTRTRGGTGLGLAISRNLARLMGGDLTLSSVPGEGSCFSLWLSAASGE